MGFSIVNNGTEEVLRYNTYFAEPLPESAERNLIQTSILSKNQYYIIEFVTSNYIKPLLEPNPYVTLKSFETEITTNTEGQHYYIAKSVQTTFLAKIEHGFTFVGDIYNVDINYLRVRPVPTYTLKKCSDGSTVMSFDPADLTQGSTVVGLETVYDNYLKLSIDLSGVAEDTYYIEFEDEGVVYQTESFNVKLTHECTIQLEWGGLSNAFNFNYSTLDYSQSLRVDAKLWKPKYAFDKNEIFRDSKGVRILNYIRQDKSKLLTIAEMPEYCHNALSLGIKHDEFTIDGADYVCEEQDYTVKWRNSSLNGSSEIEVRKQDENLVNSNCN